MWAGNLITFARWTENDHCDCNKAVTCLPEKTTRGSPQRFELEKRQVKTPPVSLTQSLMWSHFTRRPCYVNTCSIICISHGHKNNFHVPPPRQTCSSSTFEHSFPFDEVLSAQTVLQSSIGQTWGQMETSNQQVSPNSISSLIWSFSNRCKTQCTVYQHNKLGTTERNPFHHEAVQDEWRWKSFHLSYIRCKKWAIAYNLGKVHVVFFCWDPTDSSALILYYFQCTSWSAFFPHLTKKITIWVQWVHSNNLLTYMTQITCIMLCTWPKLTA